MRRLLLEIAYQGNRYHGYQVQKNAVTIASTIQDAIEKVFNTRLGITGCSRTDTGVHAEQYFFHVDIAQSISTDSIIRALNVNLPRDIAVLSCKEVPPDFHARYNVCYKEYTYKIWNGRVRNPFLDKLALQYKYPLDESLMNKCASEFVGTHDFRAFCSTGSKAKRTSLDGGDSTTRTIYKSNVTRESDMVYFKVCGNGFLYNMVRIMAGTLLLTATGKVSPGDITQILLSGDRSNAGITVPPDGLYLTRVSYTPYAYENEKKKGSVTNG